MNIINKTRFISKLKELIAKSPGRSINIFFLFCLLFALSVTLYQQSKTQTTSSQAQISGIHYYIDSQNGCDNCPTYDGKSIEKAFKTLQRVTSWLIAPGEYLIKPGDTIYLKGTFTNQILGSGTSGIAGQPIMFTSYPGQTAVIDQGNDGNGNPGFLILLDGKSYITIDSIKFTNSKHEAYNTPNYTAPAGTWGVLLEKSSNIIIKNSEFEHVAINIRNNSSNNQILNNKIINVISRYDKLWNPERTSFTYQPASAGDSVYVYNGSNDNLIQNNQIINSGHSTVQIGGTNVNDAKSYRNKLINNYIKNEWAQPVYLTSDSEQTLVEGNSFADGAITPTVYETLNAPDCNTSQIDKCSISKMRPGIAIRSSNNTIRYNFSYGNTGAGIAIQAFYSTGFGNYLFNASNNKVYGNTVYNNKTTGLEIKLDNLVSQTTPDPSLTGNLIANNIFYKNQGIVAPDGYPKNIWIEQSNYAKPWENQQADGTYKQHLNGNIITNNIVLRDPSTANEEPTKATWVLVSLYNKYHYKGSLHDFLYYTLAGYDSLFGYNKNIAADPLFINDPPVNGLSDYQLRPNSPAIDAGMIITDALYPARNYEGNAPDIGAYEYADSVPSPTPAKLGYSTVGTYTDFKNSNYINGSSFTMQNRDGAIISMSVYVGKVDLIVQNRSFQVAIYSDNDGKPGALIAKSISQTLTENSWNSVPITAALQANTKYWLMYNTNGRSNLVNNMNYSTNIAGANSIPVGTNKAYSKNSVAFGTWPQQFGTEKITNNWAFSIYATYIPQ